jgi:hypothetical protein
MIQQAFLVSAYDLAHALIPGADGLSRNPTTGPLSTPAVLFLDSGGYETQVGEQSDANRHPVPLRPWGDDQFEACLDSIHIATNLVLVNLERRANLPDQVQAARAFFDRRPQWLSDFLIKPSQGARFLDPPTLVANVTLLGNFDVIGVTEKELGTSLLERLRCLARLRTAMDANKVDAPIHVFGSLDPFLSPLYFLAGAEIFDGLTWMTHAFHPDLGLAIYSDALTALRGHWTQYESLRKGTIWASNITECEDVAMKMRQYLLAGDFSVLGPHGQQLEAGYRAIWTAVQQSGS